MLVFVPNTEPSTPAAAVIIFPVSSSKTPFNAPLYSVFSLETIGVAFLPHVAFAAEMALFFAII